ncbi:MAG: B3/B4 domain-containing protein [Vicinamibacterales bacterium]
MSFRLRVDPLIFETFPGYSVLLLYAHDLENGPSDARSAGLLRAAEAEARAAFSEAKPASHPHIAAWREAFGRFGVKPSRYPCSVEALLGRVLKGQELPAINRVVDLYNAVSIRHVLPVGGEDLDQLTSDSTLRFATGDEPFSAISGGEEVIEYPEPGEVVWADSGGVTCRRWNWRQCRRTQLTEATRNAYFVLDALSPYPPDALTVAGDDLARLLTEASPGVRIEWEVITR